MADQGVRGGLLAGMLESKRDDKIRILTIGFLAGGFQRLFSFKKYKFGLKFP